jgi:hypothetical protein
MRDTHHERLPLTVEWPIGRTIQCTSKKVQWACHYRVLAWRGYAGGDAAAVGGPVAAHITRALAR